MSGWTLGKSLSYHHPPYKDLSEMVTFSFTFGALGGSLLSSGFLRVAYWLLA